MFGEHFIYVTFLIFIGAVVFSTIALLTRQSLLVAYILLGLVLGPYGARFITHSDLLSNIGELGIIFLLFLVGLRLDPRELLESLRKVSTVTLLSTIIIWILGSSAALLFHFSYTDAAIIGAVMIFSSTIIGIKLLPDKDYFHSRVGEVMIGALLLQDIMAILMLFILDAARTSGGFDRYDLYHIVFGLPVFLMIVFAGERWIIRPLMEHFERVKEYIFLVAIAWCLGMALLGQALGLSDSTGAFIAGVAIASSSESAKWIDRYMNPLKDLFLLLFFFVIGANFDYHLVRYFLLPSIVLCLGVVIFKPLVYYFFLRKAGESKGDAKEISCRLGQASEFSLVIAAIAADITPRLLSVNAEHTIELMTLLSFIASCYFVIWRYPTPMQR